MFIHFLSQMFDFIGSMPDIHGPLEVDPVTKNFSVPFGASCHLT